MNIYEFSGGGFNKISNDNWGDFRIARDISDIDGDGKMKFCFQKKGTDMFMKLRKQGSSRRILYGMILKTEISGQRELLIRIMTERKKFLDSVNPD